VVYYNLKGTVLKIDGKKPFALRAQHPDYAVPALPPTSPGATPEQYGNPQ